MRPHLPAALLGLFGLWAGTFAGGAGFWGSAVGTAALLAGLAWAGAAGRDPLRLGRAGWLLPLALWIAVAAGAWASPVPRAGWVGVLLLPAFLLLPAAVERCWAGEAQRRAGLRAVAAVVAAVALWSLADRFLGGSPRAAMPLGHHNLLAAWLVTALPLAALPARERSGWRWLGLAAAVAGLLAMLASRSLAGSAALGLQLALAGGSFLRSWRARLLGLLLLALLLASQAGRVGRILGGEDPSARARAVYYRGAWDGFLARPVLGWGPGSAAWTAAAFLRPLPGVNPPSEIVGELHSLPLQLAYETGLTGLLLAAGLAGIFTVRRLAELGGAEDRPLLLAGLLGLAGWAVASLGTAALTVSALPLGAAVAAGGALAARPRPAEGRRRWSLAAWAAAVLVLLAPLEAARWSYERAIDRPGEARRRLEWAVRLDPAFPLYRARLGWLLGDAALAREAARDAVAVPPLWLFAGILGLRQGAPWAPDALARAGRLDPLSPFPAFFLAVADPASPRAPELGARALLAEPRLVAATTWSGREDLLARALALAASRPGADPGWHRRLEASAARPVPAEGARAWLALEVDRVPFLSLSLHAFRRRPWPLEWPLVEIHSERLPGT